MSLPKHRSELGDWLNKHDLRGSMAEIGCAFGGFSKIVLNSWSGIQYRMIDPWISQDASVYKEKQEEAWKYQRWFEECSAIASNDPRVVVMRGYSHDVSILVAEESLDCCYIDGNHSYESVVQDLSDWWPKVKRGGLFCGHDFYDATTDGHWCLVEKAVSEWSKKMGHFILTTPCSSWWVRKP